MKNLLRKRQVPLFSLLQLNRARCAVLLAAFAAGVIFAAFVTQAEAVCTEGPAGVVTCTGDESGGITYSSNTINELRAIQPINDIVPSSLTTGINLNSTSGGNVTVKAGELGSKINITTTNAGGILLQSSGTPSAPGNSVLGFPLPGSGSASGGIVRVESHSNITATSHSWLTPAYGIYATSSTTGYSPEVITSLQHFDPATVSFEVVSVDNSASNVNQQVQATRINASGTAVQGDGGSVTISNLGVPTFVTGTAFADLQEGETGKSMVPFKVLQTSSVTGGSLTTEAYFMVAATRTNGVLTYREAVYYPDYGVWSVQDPQNTASLLPLFPDLQSYIAGLVSDAAAGGAGNSVFVTSTGRIRTDNRGASLNFLGLIMGSSPGIFAQSQGANGGTGSGGGLFDGPAGVGGLGRRGGDVSVTADGEIITLGNYSAGAVAASLAGNGGTGGDGGSGGWRWGGPGGTGGNGGSVYVYGSGTIITGADLVNDAQVPTGYGDYSSGIIAISQGGDGGNGGEGHQGMPGGSGGFGGKGGTVVVDGSWNITTRGDMAHGIWAKSVGGNAGGGGSGGWLGGAGGAGGQATDGGSVTVESSGEITTSGSDSYGIYAESVGGFGGTGGLGGGIFYSRGGNGNSAGSGGTVSVTNDLQGSITTSGARGHGIYAQSIGGGGGSGGGAGALVGFGGEGAYGGNGGAVTVTNAGTVTTTGAEARGIYAQSVGGAGGDGGESVGLVAVGGRGSGTSNGSTVTVGNSGTVSTSGVDAEAIYAQSIGGGGGSGGSSTGWFSVGGNGGGGNSDVVTVNNTGSLVKTAGQDSAAIFAQSVGGGGGKGGNSVAVGAFISVGIGGDGGTGGNGDKVDVTSTGAEIRTSEADSCGIYAQSIGGGGGKGGFATSVAIGYKVSLSIGAGGDGGSGGNAGAVAVQNSSQITTGYLEEPVVPATGTASASNGNAEAKDADGIFAQSIGGGGGKGGFSITGGASDGAQLGLSVGGQGGKGGNGATVDVSNAGTITTYGDSSNGIRAQTTGGGGGNGGFSIAGGIGGAASFNMAVGGSGGDGGSAGQVVVDNSGSITTSGETAHAIMAQSTGGGGGNGGMSITASITALTKGVSAGLSIGGSGGKGGKGGDVYVGYTVVDPVTRTLATKAATGTLTTHGERSDGIFAQSVGGGGGQGGSSLAFSFSNDAAEGTSFTGDFSFGGTGGAGNTGGTVQVASGSHIVTTGDSANGIFAQSIGGGGGAGGSATSIALSTSGLFPAENFEGSTFKLKLAVGGSGGDGGKGGSVNVTNTGNIETTGALSRGIFAQSIGGGGGSVAESILGKAEKYLEGAEGFLDSGEIVKSITEVFKEGSPKSLVPHDLALNVGGNGGANGDAGTVSVTNSGTIHTIGLGAHGIFAQSIGGGGGEAQAYAKATEVEDNGSGGEEEVPGSGQSASVGVAIVGKFAIGGAGGAAGNGSTVTVGNSSTITVDGEGAFGVYAQSIGGGGGQAGSTAGGFSGFSHIGFNPAFGRDGGCGGNGADVTVTNSGTITTHGAGGIGIVAQSIGGGGGMVGDASGIAFAGSVGGYGHSGTVTVNQYGSIVTTGEAAHGIFAQSCGGLTGTDTTEAHLNPDNYNDVTTIKTDFTGGGGPVNVTLAGSIDTQGVDSIGILTQSGGAAGAGNLTVTINSGSVTGGSGTGAGVCFVDGVTNLLTNHGSISARSGVAVSGGSGNETIDNSGTITGSVDLGLGANAFNNNSTGVLNSGAVINLGAGNTFTNAGSFSPGGLRTFQTTTLTGNFRQTGSGVLDMDIDRFGNHDKLVVASGSASLGGTLAVTRGSGLYRNGMTYDIMETTDNTIAGAFANVSLPEAKPLLSFLLNQTSNLVELEVVAPKFTSVATNPTESAVAVYLDRIMPTAGGDLADVLGVIQNLSSSQIGAAYSTISPATYDGLTKAALVGLKQYLNSLRQRMNNVRAYSVAGGYDRETKGVLLAYNGSDADIARVLASDRGSRSQNQNGLWIDSYSQWGDQRGTQGVPGYDYNHYGSTIGYDYTFQNKLMLGLSFGMSRAVVDFEQSRGDGSVEGLTGSLYASYFPGNAYMEGVFSYGGERFHNHRNLSIDSIQRQATSAHNGDAYSVYLGAGYDFNVSMLAIVPFAALRYAHLDEDGFAESGADSLNLIVDPRHTDSLVSELGVRTGHAFKLTSGSLIPELSASFSYDFDIDDQVITSSFAGSPGAVFSIKGQEVDKYGAVVSAGLTFIHNSGFSTSLKYSGEFRERSASHGVIGELRYQF